MVSQKKTRMPDRESANVVVIEEQREVSTTINPRFVKAASNYNFHST
jgi:hypothetical protein